MQQTHLEEPDSLTELLSHGLVLNIVEVELRVGEQRVILLQMDVQLVRLSRSIVIVDPNGLTLVPCAVELAPGALDAATLLAVALLEVVLDEAIFCPKVEGARANAFTMTTGARAATAGRVAICDSHRRAEADIVLRFDLSIWDICD